jgi:hypothetical protein
MARWFNISGPCNPQKHYMLSPTSRLPSLWALLEQEAYFVLHAPRQSGKTTSMSAVAKELNEKGRHVSALLTVDVGAAFQDDPGAAELAILDSWREAAGVQLDDRSVPPPWPAAPAGRRIGAALAAWAKASPRPLVLFLDEIDALHDSALISVLRQLRAGFASRPAAFPSAIGLIGLRDVRDYRVASGGSERLGSSSSFNIKDKSLTLGNFSLEQVQELYSQHASDTGQAFLPEAVGEAFALTQGQPWLVNALAKLLVEELVTDCRTCITSADVARAKELLVQRQDTHLDSLAERLREDRVRRIVEPMLAGSYPAEISEDDRRFVLDLGLLRRRADGGLEVANPIYREILVRSLASGARDAMPIFQPTWLTPDRRLDPGKLLDSFLAFWRQHGAPLMRTAPYHEIAPHLVLMAFLHRVMNGGGTVEREYAIGSGRMDVLVTFGEVRLALELKVRREGEVDPLPEGLEQLDGYLAGLGLTTGWLLIFDRRSAQPRLALRTRAERASTPSGRDVVVVRA